MFEDLTEREENKLLIELAKNFNWFNEDFIYFLEIQFKFNTLKRKFIVYI